MQVHVGKADVVVLLMTKGDIICVWPHVREEQEPAGASGTTVLAHGYAGHVRRAGF